MLKRHAFWVGRTCAMKGLACDPKSWYMLELDPDLIQISFYSLWCLLSNYVERRNPEGWCNFFLSSSSNLKKGAIITAKWKYAMRASPPTRTKSQESTVLTGYEITILWENLKTNLVPVFLVWRRFSFVPKRMVSKLTIFKFIKELINHWSPFVTLPIYKCLELGPEYSWY